MAEYSKKLHIRKGSTVTDITLYTATSDVGDNYLTLKDGSTKVYAALVATTDSNATALRVKKGSTTYAAANISPLYSGVGVALVMPENYTMPGWFKIRGSGDVLYDPKPTGTVADAVGIATNMTNWKLIDKDGNAI